MEHGPGTEVGREWTLGGCGGNGGQQRICVAVRRAQSRKRRPIYRHPDLPGIRQQRGTLAGPALDGRGRKTRNHFIDPRRRGNVERHRSHGRRGKAHQLAKCLHLRRIQRGHRRRRRGCGVHQERRDHLATRPVRGFQCQRRGGNPDKRRLLHIDIGHRTQPSVFGGRQTLPEMEHINHVGSHAGTQQTFLRLRARPLGPCEPRRIGHLRKHAPLRERLRTRQPTGVLGHALGREFDGRHGHFRVRQPVLRQPHRRELSRRFLRKHPHRHRPGRGQIHSDFGGSATGVPQHCRHRGGV